MIQSSPSRAAHPLSIRGGGGVILILLLPAVILAGFIGWGLLRSGPASNPASDPESYGFDLSNFTLSRSVLAAAAPRGSIKALVDPPIMPGSDVPRLNEELRGKYLVSSDRVIGVTIAGESRAYPLRILDHHEIINDTLGGVPIAVTYNALCDAAVVFDRRYGGETLTFDVSGLLWNSNLLLFNVTSEGNDDDEAASLWSQLLARPVAGPFAAARESEEPASLTIVPSSLVTWGAWMQEQPRSTVLAFDQDRQSVYNHRIYEPYFSWGEVRFPIDPPWTEEKSPMTRVIVVRVNEETAAFELPDLLAHADARGRWTTTVGGEPITFRVTAEPPTAQAMNQRGETVSIIHAFLFAWRPMQAQAR